MEKIVTVEETTIQRDGKTYIYWNGKLKCIYPMEFFVTLNPDINYIKQVNYRKVLKT